MAGGDSHHFTVGGLVLLLLSGVSGVTAAIESEREERHSWRGVVVSVTAMTTMGHNTESQNYPQPSSSRSAASTTSCSAVNFLTDGDGDGDGDGGMVGGTTTMAAHQNALL
ncbi:unnamed protein product [Lactuca saligna]|uniref:Uncharacterized protein n=1 Tax=Lactuca saligna TaxID=75948 RepID=A0AA35V879_LACSI|nr:unnamed protein product [Lactuca saligna]